MSTALTALAAKHAATESAHPLAREDRCVRWARLPYDLLILGETGTGKSVLAAALHAMPGRSGALIECSLAQLSETTALSELFGHVRGAFTDAVADHIGHVEMARGGTLFLDELGDCLPRVQANLLLALEGRRVQRLGESRHRPVDFRLIAATHADLDAMVARGQFRQDLLARFGDYVIELQPLRERRDAILPLARTLLIEESRVVTRDRAPVLSADVESVLVNAPWPTNIRGLRNVMRYLAGNAGDVADVVDLPPRFLRSLDPEVLRSREPLAVRARRVLDEEGGCKTRAARRLRISRGHLYRVLKGT